MADIAVVGLGAMGSRTARRLIDAGQEVVVWNRDPAKAEGFPQRAATPTEAAERARVVIIMVSDPAALAAVSEGIAAGAEAGSTVVDDGSERGENRREAGDDVVGAACEDEEAPLFHLREASEDGCVEECDAVQMSTVGVAAVQRLDSELPNAFALGRHLGLTDDALFDVLAATPLAAQAERRRDAIVSGSYPPRFALTLADKDAQLILDAAGDLDLRVAQAVRSWYADAMHEGRGDEDNSALLATILEATRLH